MSGTMLLCEPICVTIRMAAGKPWGNMGRITFSALIAPADPPIRTILDIGLFPRQVLRTLPERCKVWRQERPARISTFRLSKDRGAYGSCPTTTRVLVQVDSFAARTLCLVLDCIRTRIDRDTDSKGGSSFFCTVSNHAATVTLCNVLNVGQSQPPSLDAHVFHSLECVEEPL